MLKMNEYYEYNLVFIWIILTIKIQHDFQAWPPGQVESWSCTLAQNGGGAVGMLIS